MKIRIHGSVRPPGVAPRGEGDGGSGFVFADLLFGELAPVDGHFAGEIEGEADFFALDIDDADDAEGAGGVADDDFFTDASSQSEHGFGRLP